MSSSHAPSTAVDTAAPAPPPIPVHSARAPSMAEAAATPPPIPPHLLPAADADHLRLVPTTAAEYVQTSLLNVDEWKGPLTWEQYMEREFVLQSVDLTKDGRITGWCLTSDELAYNDDGTRPILACCESIPVQAYVARGGQLQPVQAHGIASVYTRPEHRGKGYAGRMMAELGRTLETWQATGPDTPNPFSVLFSDIGPKFYARAGWKPFPSTHIHLAPLSRLAHEAACRELPAVDDLQLSDLPHIPTVRYLEERLRRASQAQPHRPHVAIRPDLEHLTWHFAREEFQCTTLQKPFPHVKGAIHRPTGIAVVWCRVYAAVEQNQQLHILATVVPPAAEDAPESRPALAALLARSQREADEWHMAGGVEVWDPSTLVVDAAQRLRSVEQASIEVISRDQEHINSLRWAAAPDDDVTWVAMEKYAWC